MTRSLFFYLGGLVFITIGLAGLLTTGQLPFQQSTIPPILIEAQRVEADDVSEVSDPQVGQDRVEACQKEPSIAPSASNLVQAQSPVMATHAKEWFPNAKVLAEKEEAGGKRNEFKRIKIVETTFKYPFIRIEELVGRDPITGKETLLSSDAMIADHVIVKVKDSITEQELGALVQDYGARIRKRMYASGMYLVKWGGYSIEAMAQQLDALNKAVESVAYAEPDYLQHLLSTFPDDPNFHR